MERRQFVLTSGTVGVLATAGCLGLFGDSPADVAESFVKALDAGKFGEADTYIHSESPLDGTGQAVDVIASIYGVDGVVDALDISVEESAVTEETDNEASVRVAVAVDIVVDEIEDEIPFQMRTDDGDWRVWMVG